MSIMLVTINPHVYIGGTLPPAQPGVAYSQFLHGYDGVPDYEFSLDAGETELTAAGFALSAAGEVYGSSADPVEVPITVRVIDAAGDTDTRTFVFKVVALPLEMSGDAPDARIGDATTYSYGVTGGSGTKTFGITSGALPPGVTLNPATAELDYSGATTPGDYAWEVTATDTHGAFSPPLADSCTIRYPLVTLTGAFQSLGIIGVPYSSDITIAGGDGTYSNPRFTAGAVSGMALTIVTVGGVKKLRLSGTPTTQETDSITVAVDAHDFDGMTMTGSHSQSVTEDPALTLSGSFTNTGLVGAAYSSDLLLGGGDGTYTLGNGGTGLAPGSGALPASTALSIVTVGGSKYLRLSSASLTTAATSNFTVSVNSGDGQNVTGAQSITVISMVVLTGTFATPLYDGVPYSQSIAISGGTGPYSSPAVASGALPSGLSLSIVGSNLFLSGTCTSGATSTFTVSCHDSLGTSATSASQSLTRQDQYFANVKALLKFNGTNGSTTITDVIGHTWTAHAPAALTTSNKKFGTAALLVGTSGGAGDVHSTSSDYSPGSGNFTVEGWKYLNGATAVPSCLFDSRSATNQGLGIYDRLSTGASFLNVFNNTVKIGDTNPTGVVAGTWVHWSICRSGTTLYGSLGGVVFNLGADSRTYAATPTIFVGNNYLDSQGDDGAQDEFRLTIGVARYTANFTPPVDEFPSS
jgi:hypothetical protein